MLPVQVPAPAEVQVREVSTAPVTVALKVALYPAVTLPEAGPVMALTTTVCGVIVSG